MRDKLSKVNHWNDFKPEEAMSSKSYRWSRQLPTPNTPCLPKQTMVIGFQTLIGILPVKCNKIRNRRNDDTACVMCGHHKETIKHLLCKCKNEEIRALITARHDKVVKELAIWGEIAQRKQKITSVEVKS